MTKMCKHHKHNEYCEVFEKYGYYGCPTNTNDECEIKKPQPKKYKLKGTIEIDGKVYPCEITYTKRKSK